MKTRLGIVGLLGILLLASCGKTSAPPSAPPSPTASAPAPTPVVIVQMEGTAAEIGTAHGKQLGEPMRNLYQLYVGRYFIDAKDRTNALIAAGSFEPRMSDDHRHEITALAGTAQMDRREVVLAQCFLDLSSMVTCSTVTLPASASPIGRPSR